MRVSWVSCMDKDDMVNHADQMNPNNDAYWESRGYDERPEDWENRVAAEDEQDDRQQQEPAGKK